MKIKSDQILNKLAITNSDDDLDQHELVAEFNDAFTNVVPNAYTLEISGLNADEIQRLHNALLCSKVPSTLEAIVYQLEPAAEKKLQQEFADWKLSLIKKAPSEVENITDSRGLGTFTRSYTVKPHGWQGPQIFSQSVYIAIDKQALQNANHSREAASTAINYYIPTKLR